MKRIYVVEYSTLVRNRIREAIAGLGDCMIVGEAEAANEAIVDIDELNPDVVITDLLLRDGTGIDVVRRVRARHGQSRPVIYVYTNHAAPSYRSVVRAAGADGFFQGSHEYPMLFEELRDVA
jgi:DNA-binding NarL/FixJ family response regulator